MLGDADGWWGRSENGRVALGGFCGEQVSEIQVCVVAPSEVVLVEQESEAPSEVGQWHRVAPAEVGQAPGAERVQSKRAERSV